jgi:hypothetical protein
VFFAKHLNVEIGVGLRHDAWIGATYWAQAKAAVDLWDGSLEGFLELVEVAVAGIDGQHLQLIGLRMPLGGQHARDLERRQRFVLPGHQCADGGRVGEPLQRGSDA